jgi:hypothetical protein
MGTPSLCRVDCGSKGTQEFAIGEFSGDTDTETRFVGNPAAVVVDDQSPVLKARNRATQLAYRRLPPSHHHHLHHESRSLAGRVTKLA